MKMWRQQQLRLLPQLNTRKQTSPSPFIQKQTHRKRPRKRRCTNGVELILTKADGNVSCKLEIAGGCTNENSNNINYDDNKQQDNSNNNNNESQKQSHRCPLQTGKPTFLVRQDFLLYGWNRNRFLFERYITSENEGGILLDTFESMVCAPEKMKLSSGATKMLNTPNAGGNSVWSEVLSYEILHANYSAVLRRTEMEIEYWPESKITDYSITVLGRHIGVSVTRAINFPDLAKKHKAVFTSEEASRLLTKKLYGIVASSSAVVDKWEKQILHIWTTSPTAANMVMQEYPNVSEELRSNTVVLLTLAKNVDWIF